MVRETVVVDGEVQQVEKVVTVEVPVKVPVEAVDESELERRKTAIFDIDGGPIADPELWNPFAAGRDVSQGLCQALSELRGMMITTDGEDYMILAEAKGLRPWQIFWRYGIRNAILPQVTGLGVSLGALASGVVIVETIFTYPSMGYLLYNRGILNNDYTVIQGIVFYVIVGVSWRACVCSWRCSPSNLSAPCSGTPSWLPLLPLPRTSSLCGRRRTLRLVSKRPTPPTGGIDTPARLFCGD